MVFEALLRRLGLLRDVDAFRLLLFFLALLAFFTLDLADLAFLAVVLFLELLAVLREVLFRVLLLLGNDALMEPPL